MKTIKPLLAICLALPVHTVFAQSNLIEEGIESIENGYTLDAFLGLEYDDNVRPNSDNDESDLKQLIGVGVGYQYESRVFDIDLQYRISHESYQDNSYPGKTRIEGQSRTSISTFPERYAWVIDHRQTISSINSKGSDNPDNTDQRSVLSTGPDFNLQLSPVDTLTASARYTDTRFDETSSNDSQRTSAQLSWSHRLNTLSNVGFNVSHTDVDGDQSGYSYSQEKAGVTYSRNLKSGNLSIEVGESWLERDQAGFENVNGGYGNVNYNATWEGSSLVGSVSRDVTDSSIGLSQDYAFNDDFEDGDINFDQLDVIIRTRYQINYLRKNASGRFSAEVTLAQDEQDYVTLLDDEESQSVSILMRYAVSQTIAASFNSVLRKTEYIDQPLFGDDKNVRVSFNISQSIGDRWDIDYRLSHDERKNNLDNAREYNSMRFIVNANYRFR